MNCLLLYYTGTFNTRYITGLLQDRLAALGWNVTRYEIDPTITECLDLSRYDIVGLGYPIYGFCAPYAFLRFIRAQRFPCGQKVFIYKNSGETETANDASSKYVVRHLRHCGVKVSNEYHFIMPYNIHFRFDEYLIKEMLLMDAKLMDILVFELRHGIANSRPYKFWPRLVSSLVSRPQYIGGNVNSFLYRVDKTRCIDCDLCIRRCPTKNIYRDTKGTIRFHHSCIMCMRCSLYCPKDAIHIGFLESWGWKVNGGYNFQKIEKIAYDKPYITSDTTGFFKCYVRTYNQINERHAELFGAASEGWYVVTGATGSMGQVAVERLAREGRKVIMACRNVSRGNDVAQRIRNSVPGAVIEMRELNLESRASVKAFAEGLSGYKLGALFNNAGTMQRRYSLTVDGVEKTVAVNLLNLAYLTFLLIPHMVEGARIVNMVSLSARFASLSSDWEAQPETGFSQIGTYAMSKRALISFSVALAKHHKELRVNVADPGIVDSKMISLDRWFDPLADVIFRPFISSPAKGVAPALRALQATGSLSYYVGHGSKPIGKRYASADTCESIYTRIRQILELD